MKEESGIVGVKEIAQLIASRDNISIEEAYESIQHCQTELDMIVSAGGSLDDAEECVAFWLGLESDFLPDLLDC